MKKHQLGLAIGAVFTLATHYASALTLNVGQDPMTALKEIQAQIQAIKGASQAIIPPAPQNQMAAAMIQPDLEEAPKVGGNNDAVKGDRQAGLAPQLHKIQADGKLRLMQGSHIPAVLNMGINSDLPSELTAVVTSDVYDSVEGMTLLIPKGSKLVASVGNDVLLGQERLMISFTRLIFPDGSYVMLPKMAGADEMGYSGADANVNNHFFKQFGAGLLMALMTYRVEKLANGNVTVNVSGSGSTTSLQSSVGQVLNTITGKMLDRYTNLKPTLTVDPGTRIKVIVSTDMELDPYPTN